jgi:hypothetical protein
MSRAVIALVVAGVLVVGIVAGVLIGGGGDDTTTTDDEAEATPATVEETTAPETTESPTTTAAPTTTTTVPGFEDGQHLVPSEVAPGRWSTPGRENCGRNRLSGIGGTRAAAPGPGRLSALVRLGAPAMIPGRRPGEAEDAGGGGTRGPRRRSVAFPLRNGLGGR